MSHDFLSIYKVLFKKLNINNKQRKKMIVKIEGPIKTFAKWKAMVHNNAEKINKYGKMISLETGATKITR